MLDAQQQRNQAVHRAHAQRPARAQASTATRPGESAQPAKVFNPRRVRRPARPTPDKIPEDRYCIPLPRFCHPERALEYANKIATGLLGPHRVFEERKTGKRVIVIRRSGKMSPESGAIRLRITVNERNGQVLYQYSDRTVFHGFHVPCQEAARQHFDFSRLANEPHLDVDPAYMEAVIPLFRWWNENKFKEPHPDWSG